MTTKAELRKRLAKAAINAQTRYAGWGNLDEPQRIAASNAVGEVLKAAGYAIVPVEPTEAMMAANSKATKQFFQDGGVVATADGFCHVEGLATLAITQWQAMLRATEES